MNRKIFPKKTNVIFLVHVSEMEKQMANKVLDLKTHILIVHMD